MNNETLNYMEACELLKMEPGAGAQLFLGYFSTPKAGYPRDILEFFAGMLEAAEDGGRTEGRKEARLEAIAIIRGTEELLPKDAEEARGRLKTARDVLAALNEVEELYYMEDPSLTGPMPKAQAV